MKSSEVMKSNIRNSSGDSDDQNRTIRERKSSESITSLFFAQINDRASIPTETMPFKPQSSRAERYKYSDEPNGYDTEEEFEHNDFKLESGAPVLRSINPVDKKFRRFFWIVSTFFVGIWIVSLFIFLGQRRYLDSSINKDESLASTSHTKKETITLDQILDGQWQTTTQKISWIEGPNGEDGLLLKEASSGNDYLIVEDIRKDSNDTSNIMSTMTLMKDAYFNVGDLQLTPSYTFPSKDLRKVLIATDARKHWRHSFHAKYWIFDVDTQTAQPLDPEEPEKSIQLASWSPQSNAIVFTRDNNLFLRDLSSPSVIQITEDGGTDVFYGIPDWVYEEEVFAGNSATWWAEDGKYIAFLRTNESLVPEFPIQYFLSKPSLQSGEENYPNVQNIKYPKAGAPNPLVELQFYDVEMQDVFQVKLADSFAPDDLLITEVVWAGSTGTALIRESNRESDILRVVLIDVISRTGKLARTKNSQDLDGGWFEISEFSKYIPADPLLGRPHDGYIDTVVSNNFNHLGYFTPLDNPEPILLTSGDWEVENAPSAVDLKNNLVYFIATKESPIERHVYSVNLNGDDLKPLTNVSEEGYYSASFSSGSGFALVNYNGPNIPWQRVISTHGSSIKHDELIEDNGLIAELVRTHDLPTKIYSSINIDGFELQTVEQRPSHFHHKKEYPVLFHVYGGPGSQMVTKKFNVDFQSYVAATLGYIVVTVDGRGTGFTGRKARTQVRGNLGYYEAHDQIEAAKIWSERNYVDSSRLAIWGWSYGGFMTLKTLEQDAGKTFSYGMAVAPVTDWRFYDSIYTERYMHTPEQNPTGYLNSSINNMTALESNVRFLIVHGTADDNVHLQNTLTLLDKLDIASVENYDVHIFPDSDHSIYFHNANTMVYRKLSDWLINAFNGEWLDILNPVPRHDKHHHHTKKHHK